MKSVIIINKDSDSYIELSAKKTYCLDVDLNVVEDGIHRIEPNGNDTYVDGQLITPNKYVTLENGYIAVFLWEVTKYVRPQELIISNDSFADVCFRSNLANGAISDNTFISFDGTFYHNGKRRNNNEEITLENGDVLFYGKNKIVWNEEYITIISSDYSSKLAPYNDTRVVNEDFPQYKRSARIVMTPKSERIKVNSPETPKTQDRGDLVKVIVPPLVSIAATVAIGVFLGRGVYMYLMALTSVVSLCFSITSWIQNRKENKEKEAKNKTNYERYLLNKRKELYSAKNQETEALLYMSPNSSTIGEMIEKNSDRLYERSATDGDFLCVSLGKASKIPEYVIDYDKASETSESELMQEMFTVCHAFEKIDDMPLVCDLKESHLAIVGDKRYTRPFLFDLISQISFFHSYHDIEFVVLTDNESVSSFSWMRWLPHTKIKAININGLITNEKVRDQVLGNLTQTLKVRREQVEEKKQDLQFLPYIVFIVDNPKLVMNHSIMEYLQSKDLTLCYRLIWLSNLESNVPENIKTMVNVFGAQRAVLKIQNGVFVNKNLALNNTIGVDFNRQARRLAAITHLKQVSSQIPENVSFFEMYNIKDITRYDLETVWEGNDCSKSLSVPLGMKSMDDILYLNLHEKAHGPHGLIAGTTGSGKSELVQSLILSLAMNFSPYEVGFLLIDYKGGGMANLFEKLPHLLGTITNLDGSESSRALTSIKAELDRRQRIFNDCNINSINQYTRMFRAGEVSSPLPHLFIISDEFAELKKEQPEFMHELVSTARIGRSLGVHLILATQKPGGVVDDQIWSNSKFKLALKVQEEGDSREILKNADAASIVQIGRAILQVGNNEVYDMFQSAYSGAPYRTEAEKNAVDTRVYLINSLGQNELLNNDLSAGPESKDTKLTELDVAVNYIHQVFSSKERYEVTKPWLPPLPSYLVSPYIDVNTISDISKCIDADYAAPLGLIDIPELQLQSEYLYNPVNDGNLIVFSAIGFGKTTVLVNLVLSLAVKTSVEILNVYLWDLGNSGLQPLKGLPQVADYISSDDVEKREKFINFLEEEIVVRRRLLSQSNCLNFSMYNQKHENKLPLILVVIDNYDFIREFGFDFENKISVIIRDGINVGVNFVVSASKANYVKSSVMNVMKNRLCLYMYDASDAYSIVGRPQSPIPEIKGRALIKDKSDIHMMQLFVPVDSSDELEYVDRVLTLCETIKKSNSGKEAKPLPVLPEKLFVSDLPKSKMSTIIPIGLETEKCLPRTLDFHKNWIVYGASKTGKTNVLKTILSQSRLKSIIFDPTEELTIFSTAENYFDCSAPIENFLNAISSELENNKRLYAESQTNKTLKQFYSNNVTTVIIIDDVDVLISEVPRKETAVAELLESCAGLGISVLCAVKPEKLKGFDELSKWFKHINSSILLGAVSEQSIITVKKYRNEKLPKGYGIVFEDGLEDRIFLAKS